MIIDEVLKSSYKIENISNLSDKLSKEVEDLNSNIREVTLIFKKVNPFFATSRKVILFDFDENRKAITNRNGIRLVYKWSSHSHNIVEVNEIISLFKKDFGYKIKPELFDLVKIMSKRLNQIENILNKRITNNVSVIINKDIYIINSLEKIEKHRLKEVHLSRSSLITMKFKDKEVLLSLSDFNDFIAIEQIYDNVCILLKKMTRFIKNSNNKLKKIIGKLTDEVSPFLLINSL
jgi:hypothetical protein